MRTILSKTLAAKMLKTILREVGRAAGCTSLEVGYPETDAIFIFWRPRGAAVPSELEARGFEVERLDTCFCRIKSSLPNEIPPPWTNLLE